MDTELAPDASLPNPSLHPVPLLALTSTFALAAAGTLFACSFFSTRKRRMPVPAKVCVGALVACVGALTWKNRHQEADAARHLVAHVTHARNARWLRKNPIAYA